MKPPAFGPRARSPSAARFDRDNPSLLRRRLTVGVSAGDALADVAAAIQTAIAANTDLPVTAAVDKSHNTKINITARHKGAFANDIDIRHSHYDGEGLPDGLTLAISALSGGAANPDITTVWAAIGDEHYNVVTMPYTDAANLTALESELADRWGPCA